jgi:hypothetical protein
LAGGISRIYVAFAQMVQHDPLTEFSAVMLRILDQLGPAYQARLKHLSPQQRKLIASLASKPKMASVLYSTNNGCTKLIARRRCR